ncbi:MAG TPA: ATP-binding cassette domain-containing protein, partial [Bradyrhizobium sp.]|nr:ATP-binding cassette domain-containing protein [Bradyrhizobium sp.]
MLKIKGLRKSFGSVIAADDIDLSVAQGEALGIIGPNGAGKTTLFNLIAGGLAPDAGEIHLDGRDITAASPHQRCIAGIGRS